MAHDVDGYQIAFTGQNTWRVECPELGVIPATPDNDAVWFRKKHWDEMESHLADRRPFAVALYEPKDPNKRRRVKRFLGIYEVVATGERASEWGIETRIVRRIIAGTGHA